MKAQTTPASPDKPQHPGSAPQVDTNANTKAAAMAGSGGDDPPAKVKEIEFDKIQGNCFGGFLKDHQVNILFRIDDADANRAKATLGPSHNNSEATNEPDPDYENGIFSHIAHSSSEAVIRFNEQFKAVRRTGMPEGTIKATWTNIVFTASGLNKLLPTKRAKLSQAFEEGMRNRAALIGDLDVPENGSVPAVENAPAHWNDGMDVEVNWEEVDGMLILASDDPNELDRLQSGSRLARTLAKLEAAGSGITILGIIRGETRVDDVGHEHFGFKDGVSQPGIRGVDSPDDPLHNPDQGNPGQDLLHPGEFVIGYPGQKPFEKAGGHGLNTDEGAIAGAEEYDKDGNIVPMPKPFPPWATNGSFLVFRRLAQEVKGFREAVSQKGATLGLTTDLMGAKLVGRYRSGAPLEALSFQSGTASYQPPEIDPGIAHPALANSDALNNNFEYGEDRAGEIVPLAAHIRKAYPRNQIPRHEAGQDIPNGKRSEADAESKTQTHRLLRRGIPFGKSLGAGEGGGEKNPRGLLFFAYQSDIERQFEFVQTAWVNDADFPRKQEGALPAAGQDPIITNDTAQGPIRGCPFHALADKSKCPVMTFGHFVNTRGGAYFFSPSIDTLGTWLA